MTKKEKFELMTKRKTERIADADVRFGISLEDAFASYNQAVFDMKNARIAFECAERIFALVPTSKKIEVLGELNDLFLFISAARAELKEKAKE